MQSVFIFEIDLIGLARDNSAIVPTTITATVSATVYAGSITVYAGSVTVLQVLLLFTQVFVLFQQYNTIQYSFATV